MKIDYEITKIKNVILDDIIRVKLEEILVLKVEFDDLSKRSYTVIEYGNDLKSLIEYIEYINCCINSAIKYGLRHSPENEIGFEQFLHIKEYEEKQLHKIEEAANEDDAW